MIIEGNYQCEYNDAIIDYICLVGDNASNKVEINLSWDDSFWWTEEDGTRSFRCKGVYFNDEYANKMIGKLPSHGTYECQYYSNENDEEICDGNLIWFKILDYYDESEESRYYECSRNMFNERDDN